MQDNLISSLKMQLYEKASLTKELTNKYPIGLEDLHSLLNDDVLKVFFYMNIDELTSNGLSLTQWQIEQLEKGEIVEGELAGHFLLPFVIFKTDNAITAIIPNKDNNTIALFRTMITIVLIICAALGSLLIALATRMIIQPIKKLTLATKEISKGNFDLKLATTSRDELGQLADNFNIMTEELKNIQYLRKDFISSVSHEFRTPITSIQGFAKLLKDRNLVLTEADEYVDIIISESSRLENLSSNLLKLSSLENQAIFNQHRTYALDEQIRKVILLLEIKWSEKNMELDLDFDKAYFCGDEELMQQVWINLISNAIKFSNEGGDLKIQIKEDKNKICIAIADNGTGIAEEDKELVFEKFYQGDKSRNKQGNGLGLSIVKKIVELHGGKVFFHSKLGYGSTFIVELQTN
jgi:signal transduction histidine kinase